MDGYKWTMYNDIDQEFEKENELAYLMQDPFPTLPAHLHPLEENLYKLCFVLITI